MRPAIGLLAIPCLWAACGNTAPLIPGLTPYPRDPRLTGFQAVEIHLPWEDAGRVVMRIPETLSCDLGLLFIDHARADMPPVAAVERLPDWRRDDRTRALSYDLRLPNGVSFGASATPADGRVEFDFWVRNETDKPLTRINTQFCLTQNSSPAFSQGDLTRTYIHSGGKWLALADTTHEVMNPERGPWIITGVGASGMAPHSKLEGCWYCCPERGDYPVIATTSPDGKRVIALSWEQGISLMSNGWIPCLHCDPQWPDCPPGQTVHLRGRLYITDAGLDALWETLSANPWEQPTRPD